jgi:hypothetical protein
VVVGLQAMAWHLGAEVVALGRPASEMVVARDLGLLCGHACYVVGHGCHGNGGRPVGQASFRGGHVLEVLA